MWTLSSSKPYQPLPLNSFPNRHPRARATAMTFYESQSCRLPARKGSKPFQKFQTPRARATAMSIFIGFQSCRFQPAKALNFPKQNSKHLPQQAPQGQGHFPNRHPRARPQQWLSMGFQSCRLPARKRSKTLQTLQTLPKPAGTPGPGHSNGFLWAFKAAVCQPANAPKLSKRSKPSQNPPNPPNTVRSRPSRSTAMTFLMLSKLPFASLQRLQPHLPQQAPQGQGHFPNRHPRAKATSPTGTPRSGHSNGFLWAFKAAVCQPANAPKLSKRSKCSQNPPNPPNTVRSRPSRSTAMTFLRLSKLPFASLQRLQPHLPQQAPQGQGHFPNRHPRARPQQWLSMGFQSCRLPARKRSETLQTLQMLPKPAKPSKHRPQQALQIHSTDFLEAFKAAVCEPAKAATPPSPTGTPGPRPLPQQAPQGQATAMAFYGLSKLPFASPQTLQNSPNAPNPPKPAKPSKHRPQQAPQATTMAFLMLSKLPFASLQRLQPHLP